MTTPADKRYHPCSFIEPPAPKERMANLRCPRCGTHGLIPFLLQCSPAGDTDKTAVIFSEGVGFGEVSGKPPESCQDGVHMALFLRCRNGHEFRVSLDAHQDEMFLSVDILGPNMHTGVLPAIWKETRHVAP